MSKTASSPLQGEHRARATAIVKILAVCLTASTVISIIKMVYGNSVGSLAFFADGIHSLFDSGSTIVGIISVWEASKPPDKDHPYGHKKVETVSALVLAMLLLLAGFEVGEAAYRRLMTPETIPNYSHWGLVILGATMVVNLSVALMESRAAKRLESTFLEADSLHNQSDFIITCGVFISFIASKYRIPYADPITSFGIAFYLAFLAVRVFRMNLKPLTDHRVLDPKSVEQVAYQVNGVRYCHNVRSRGEKHHHFLDLNIHLPGGISLRDAHDITHKVEAKLRSAFPGLVDVVIHTEPEDHPPCEDKTWV